MGEEKNTTAEGQSSKKSVSGQKTSAGKSQKAQLKSEAQTKLVVNTVPTVSFAKKIDDFGEEIARNPVKSFEKKEREKLIQSYERLISKMIREINNSRI